MELGGEIDLEVIVKLSCPYTVAWLMECSECCSIHSMGCEWCISCEDEVRVKFQKENLCIMLLCRSIRRLHGKIHMKKYTDLCSQGNRDVGLHIVISFFIVL